MGNGDRARPRQGHADSQIQTEKATGRKENGAEEEDVAAERRSFRFLRRILNPECEFP